MIPMPPDAMRLHRAMIALYATLAQMSLPKGTPHLSPPTIFLLACIGDQELSSSQIGESGYWFGKNQSYALSLLCNAGLAQRRGIKGDKRVVLYSLTENGLALCARIRKDLSSHKENYNALPVHSNGSGAVSALMGLPSG